MIEAERKLHFANWSAAQIVEILGHSGLVFGDPVRQTDFVHARSMTALMRGRPGSVVARVRLEGESASLTVKRRISGDEVRDEVEVPVADGALARYALTLAGLPELVVVEKTRRKAKLDTEASVTCDEVEGLGTFLEVEVLVPTEDDVGRLDEVFELVRGLLPPGGKSVSQGYDRLLLMRAQQA